MTTDYKKWVRWNKVCRLICWTLEILVVFAFIALCATIGDKNIEIKHQKQIIEQYENRYGNIR